VTKHPPNLLGWPEDPVHDVGTALHHRAYLLAVNQLGHDGALVPDQIIHG
jgi:hypothetical protein